MTLEQHVQEVIFEHIKDNETLNIEGLAKEIVKRIKIVILSLFD